MFFFQARGVGGSICARLGVGAALAIAALGGNARAGALAVGGMGQNLESIGVGSSFQREALEQFKSMGFVLDARIADFDAMGEDGDRLAASLGVGRSAVFSAMRGAGKASSCLVGLRAARWANAPERTLVAAGAVAGVEPGSMWRVMARHELGHCALAQLATRAGPPPSKTAESFADVFALSWTARYDAAGLPLAKGFAAARARSSSALGDHGTAQAIDSWIKAGLAGSPCEDAWAAAPLDSRSAKQACPAGIGNAGRR